VSFLTFHYDSIFHQVKHLIFEEDMLVVLLETMIKLFCIEIDEGSANDPSSVPIYKLDVRRFKRNFRRTLYPFYDLK